MYIYYAKLLKVKDGDTVDALIDQGFGDWTEESLRFITVDTAESKEELGPYWTKYVINWFAKNPIFIVQTFKTRTGRDKMTFNRYMADIRSLNGESLIERMLNDGAPLWVD